MKPSKTIQQMLHDQHATATPRDQEAFWSDFKARAALYPQHGPEPAMTVRLPYGRWAMAAAAALVLIATLTYHVLSPTIPDASGVTIHSVRVDVDHKGVMIMEDQPSRATIVWVVDMANGEGETGT